VTLLTAVDGRSSLGRRGHRRRPGLLPPLVVRLRVPCRAVAAVAGPASAEEGQAVEADDPELQLPSESRRTRLGNRARPPVTGPARDRATLEAVPRHGCADFQPGNGSAEQPSGSGHRHGGALQLFSEAL
jgi:hypothetical protein